MSVITTEEASSLLSKLKGKKRLVAKLLREGGYTDEQIAAEVGCKVQYVWKIRSELKKAGFFDAKTRLEDQSRACTVGSGTLVTDQEINGQEKVVPMELISDTKAELRPKQRKIIYTQFLAGKKPPQVIAAYGFPTDLLEVEYKKFLKYSLCDINSLQKEYMEQFQNDIDGAGAEAEQLVKKYQEEGYLSNVELLKLLRLTCNGFYQSGIDSVANVGKRPPEGWIRIPCDVCGEPITGVVVDPKNEMGKDVLRYCKEEWKHSECHIESGDKQRKEEEG